MKQQVSPESFTALSVSDSENSRILIDLASQKLRSNLQVGQAENARRTRKKQATLDALAIAPAAFPEHQGDAVAPRDAQ